MRDTVTQRRGRLRPGKSISILRRRFRRGVRRLPPETGAVLAGSGFLAVGFALLRSGAPAGAASGAISCLLGFAILIRAAWTSGARVRDRLERSRKVRARSELRMQRRARDAREQTERHRRLEQDRHAAAKNRTLDEARRRNAAEEALAAEQRRAARHEAAIREAERLHQLEEPALMEAVTRAFQARGFGATRPAGDGGCDILLDSAGVLVGVARVAPPSRIVAPVEVEAVAQWRTSEGAASAYLIGLSGFRPDAVRLAAALSVTLVEAHLLAQWLIAAEAGSGETNDF